MDGYLAALCWAGGGGGSSAHEARKKAARSARDNENFINEKLGESYLRSDSLPIIKSLFSARPEVLIKGGTNTMAGRL